MTMFLHVFHPTFHQKDWRTENYSIVLATADREAGMVLARGSGMFHGSRRLVHQVFPITEGAVLVAEGHDHAYLTVNGEVPPEA